jgi:hypothetical protein
MCVYARTFVCMFVFMRMGISYVFVGIHHEIDITSIIFVTILSKFNNEVCK